MTTPTFQGGTDVAMKLPKAQFDRTLEFYRDLFAVLYLGWFSLYVVVVDRLGRVLRRPRIKSRIERVTGLLLVGFAIRLANAHQTS